MVEQKRGLIAYFGFYYLCFYIIHEKSSVENEFDQFLPILHRKPLNIFEMETNFNVKFVNVGGMFAVFWM